jgi:glycerol-3-phosphate dehydrogenase
LRYLEHLKYDLVKTALAERKLLVSLGPHRVLPLRLAVPLFRGARVGPFQMKLGLSLYDWLAGSGQPVQPHRFYNARDFTNEFPLFKKSELRAGFSYGDCQTDDARFVLEIVQGAMQAGATAVNYARATELIYTEEKVSGAIVKDCQSGDTLEVRAAITVNAAGAWNEMLFKHPAGEKYTIQTKGVHLVMPPLPCSGAFLVMTEQDNRIFFILPWYGKTLLGTTDTSYSGDPDKVAVEDEDIDYLLNEANRVLQAVQWKRQDICGSYAGIRSLRNEQSKAPSAVTREWSLERPGPGLLMPIGGKFTSARADSQQIVDIVCQLLGLDSADNHPTETRPFPWTPGEEYEQWKSRSLDKSVALGIDREIAGWLVLRFGTRVEKIRELIQEDSSLAEAVIPGLPFCRAELIYCAGQEMVNHLEDLVRRRIPLVLLASLTRKDLKSIADLIAPVLNWTKKKVQEEVRTVAKRWKVGK